MVRKPYNSSIRTTRETPLALVEPQYLPARDVPEQFINTYNEYLQWDMGPVFDSNLVALDYETKGNDPTHPDFQPVGVGLAWDTGRVYINLKNWSSDDIVLLHTSLQELGQTVPTVAHNVYFDGGVYYRVMQQHLEWAACTYGLYKQLTSEGFPGQRYGLKNIQSEILCWTETNEVDLDRWLIDNGHIRNVSTTEKQGYTWYPEWADTEGRWVAPEKGEMWRAPSAILGKYCMLDCEATYLLYKHILHPLRMEHEALDEYHSMEFLHLVKKLIEQRAIGIVMDRDHLLDHQAELEKILQTTERELREYPETKEFIARFERKIYKEHLSKEPPRHKKLPVPPKEPKKYKKNGEISKSWKNWTEKILDPKYKRLEIRKDWLAWEEKRLLIKEGKHPDTTLRWNINSGPQRIELLYNWYAKGHWREKTPHIPDPRGGKYPKQRGVIELERPDGRVVELEMTDSGALPTGKIALQQLGDVGEILLRYNAAKKEHEYVTTYLELMRYDEDTGLWTLHPSWNVPGTLTGRLGGRDPNIQQVPKTPGTTSGFIPRPGMIWVDNDHSALEQVVLAELSRDPTLLKLYGPKAKKNDVYLFVGSHLPGGVGAAIRATGYDPDNPTDETISAAKKACKRERSISKVVVLASSYGAGWYKIYKTLSLSGIDITEEEVQEIHATYWRLFAGIKKWEKELVSEWNARGGWYQSGLGLPVCLYHGAKKDIVNRNCQKTGHDIHTMYVRIICELLDDEGILWNPIIIDWHDQSIVECWPEDAERVAYLIGHKAYDILNEELGGLVPLRGDPQIIDNLSYAKCESDEIEEYLAHFEGED